MWTIRLGGYIAKKFYLFLSFSFTSTLSLPFRLPLFLSLFSRPPLMVNPSFVLSKERRPFHLVSVLNYPPFYT